MDFVFKAFFLQFLVLGLLLQVVRPQTGGTDCRGKDYLCLDDVRFQLCVDYGDGRPVTVNDEVQQCPSGTFCSNGGHYECDSFVPPATTAAPQVGDVTETEPEAEEVTTSVPVEVEEATLPPVEEAAPDAGVPEPEEPAQEQATTEAQVPEVPTTEAEVVPETTVAVEEELVTEAATEPSVEEETATTGVPVPEEVETEAATEEVVAPSTESSNPEVPEVTEGAQEPEEETEAPQEQEQDTTVAVEVTTTAVPEVGTTEQEEQTEAATEEAATEEAATEEAAETESSVATDAPVEEEQEEEEVEEPVVTDAPATTENVETEAPVEPSTTSASVTEEEASEAASQPTTDLPEEAPEEVTAPEAPETTPAVVTEEPSASESGSDEGESSGAAQESTEQPSAESGSNEAVTTTTTTTVAPSGDTPFLCTTAGRFPHPTDCHKYYICFWLPFGLYNLEQNCLAGFAYNPTLERCTADQSVCFPGQFTCTAPGRFPDPADPTKYFWCVWNAFGGYLQYGLQCPLGQVFNQFRGRCAFVVAGRSLDAEEPLLTEEESVGTAPVVVAPVEPVAPQEALPTKLKVKFECLEEGTFADPNNCARYFVCTLKKLDKFKKSKFKCITGERFDALVGACVPDLDALCE